MPRRSQLYSRDTYRRTGLHGGVAQQVTLVVAGPVPGEGEVDLAHQHVLWGAGVVGVAVAVAAGGGGGEHGHHLGDGGRVGGGDLWRKRS